MTEREFVEDVTQGFSLREYKLRVASFEYEYNATTFREFARHAASVRMALDVVMRTAPELPPGELADLLDDHTLTDPSESDLDLIVWAA